MNSIKKITKEDIEELFDGRIFSRGEEYFEEGLVESVELLDENTIIGTVVGNDRYKVTISVDSEGDIGCDCTCPYEFNCKHAAALLLKWMSIKSNFNKRDNMIKINQGQFNKDTIKDIISKKSKEELSEFILDFLNRNPELKSLIVLRKNEIPQKIKVLFSRFWDWNEVRKLISELELILEGIKKSKTLWGKELLEEMEKSSNIILKGIDSVHDDEGVLSSFLEDWYETYGEIFSSTNPSKEEKIEFIKKILKLNEKDEYGMEESYEKAFLGMCKNIEDIELIKANYKHEDHEDNRYHDEFFLGLYEKVGDNKKFLEFSKEKDFSVERIRKLIQLERFEEALKDCEKQKEFSEEIENMKIELFRRFGKNEEIKKILFNLANETEDMSYVKRLKKECNKSEWNKYLKKLIASAIKNNWKAFVSRIYFNEEDYKNAYEYSKGMSETDYLELLSKKLSKDYPNYSCQILRKLCFNHINSGSGWPYKKTGELLKEIKKVNNSGSFFKKTKNEIIIEHKKKYSLMEIIEKV